MKSPSYFELRDVEPDFYQDSKLPVWLEKYLLSHSRDAQILDYGCGFGQMIKSLSVMGFEKVVGVDIDQKALEFVKSEGLNAYHPQELSSSGLKKFDIIIMSHVLEHLPKDEMIPILSQISDMLVPGGSLILMVPNAQSNTGSYWRWEDFTHEWLFTSGSIKYVLKAAGFSYIEFVDINATEGLSFFRRWLKKFLLWIYVKNLSFWNEVTSSSYHRPSPPIFSFEIKLVAKKINAPGIL